MSEANWKALRLSGTDFGWLEQGAYNAICRGCHRAVGGLTGGDRVSRGRLVSMVAARQLTLYLKADYERSESGGKLPVRHAPRQEEKDGTGVDVPYGM